MVLEGEEALRDDPLQDAGQGQAYLFLLLGMEELTKLVISLVRMLRGKWITDLTAVH